MWILHAVRNMKHVVIIIIHIRVKSSKKRERKDGTSEMRNWNKKSGARVGRSKELCDMWRRKWCAQIHFCCVVVSIYFSQRAEYESRRMRERKKSDAPWAPSRCLACADPHFCGPEMASSVCFLVPLIRLPAGPQKFVLLLRLARALRTETKTPSTHNFRFTNNTNKYSNILVALCLMRLYQTWNLYPACTRYW
jgi:hypothetical protein